MIWIRMFSLVMLIVVGGCSAPRTRRPAPGPRPLGSDLAPQAKPADVESAERAPPRPDRVLTLRAGLRLALLGNPELAAASSELRAAEARSLQARLLPNPELEVEVEEFGGKGERAGFGGSEASLSLAQALPLGGRLGDQRRVAALDREVAAWEHEAKRLEVYATTARAFFGALAAQERLKVGEDTVRLGEGILSSVTDQVKAGKVAPLVASKARVELSLLRLRRDRRGQELDSRRRELAATWGSSDPAFERVEGRLDRLRTVPDEARVMAWIGENPDIGRLAADIAGREAELDLARAEAVPDLVLHAGISRYEETDDHAFSAGLSLDLPLFDRNQGGVAEAKANLRKARAEARAAALGVRMAIADAYRALVLATDQARALRDEVVPTARSALAATREAFTEGKEGLLGVLDAQRTLVDAGGELIDAYEAHHVAATQVERLVGRSLDRLDADPDGRTEPSESDSARKEPHHAR